MLSESACFSLSCNKKARSLIPPTMKHLLPFAALLLLLSTFGCDQQNDQIIPGGTNDPQTQQAEQAPPEAQQAEVPARKLIREGWVEFETENIATTRNTVFQALEKYKGYASSDQENRSPDRTSNTLVLRVPSEHFDAFLNEATAGVTHFERKNIQAKDVTEAFLDIEARLKTKKELESRLMALLKQANTVAEILEIEKQAGELRAEIESIEGKMNYLQSQISFSTLTLTFYERHSQSVSFGNPFSNAFRNGWENVIWFFVFLVNLWPFILIGLMVLVGLRYFRKK
ncbi:MAG: DUF4349 domain-containing protein [Bacteroidetes bacterium]|nr:MAG: DUF4349 domain-containing protein [Bacteroidota bacterium]